MALRVRDRLDFARPVIWASSSYGLVRMEKGKGLKLVPKVIHDRVELVLPLIERRKSKGTRK